MHSRKYRTFEKKTMKKIYLLAIVLFGAFASYAQSKTGVRTPEQVAADQAKKAAYKHSIKQAKAVLSLYPFSMISSNFMMGLEVPINDQSSVKINGSIGFKDNSNYYGVSNYNANYVELQWRNYLSKKGTMGIFVAPYVLNKQMSFTSDKYDPQTGTIINQDGAVRGFGGGLVVGAQGWIQDIATVDFYIGGGPLNIIGDKKLLDSTSPIDSWDRGISLQIGASIGVKIR